MATAPEAAPRPGDRHALPIAEAVEVGPETGEVRQDAEEHPGSRFGRTFAVRRSEKFDANQVMVGQGLPNVLGGVFASFEVFI